MHVQTLMIHYKSHKIIPAMQKFITQVDFYMKLKLVCSKRWEMSYLARRLAEQKPLFNIISLFLVWRLSPFLGITFRLSKPREDPKTVARQKKEYTQKSKNKQLFVVTFSMQICVFCARKQIKQK